MINYIITLYMFNIGIVLVILIFICIAWYHFAWHKENPDRLMLLIILISLGVFVYIFFEHLLDCYDQEEKYKKDKDKWIREYMTTDYINTENKSLKLLQGFMKHPLISSGSSHDYGNGLTFRSSTKYY